MTLTETKKTLSRAFAKQGLVTAHVELTGEGYIALVRAQLSRDSDPLNRYVLNNKANAEVPEKVLMAHTPGFSLYVGNLTQLGWEVFLIPDTKESALDFICFLMKSKKCSLDAAHTDLCSAIKRYIEEPGTQYLALQAANEALFELRKT